MKNPVKVNDIVAVVNTMVVEEVTTTHLHCRVVGIEHPNNMCIVPIGAVAKKSNWTLKIFKGGKK